MTCINTPHAPAAIGPYSQAVDTGQWVFCSGQIALDPKTMTMVSGDTAAQTTQVLHNLTAVLTQAGLGLVDVVKTTVFLASMDDFAAMNQVYTAFFGDHKPARAAIEVARLPKDARVEIECIALRASS